jgi:hypothetical protein
MLRSLRTLERYRVSATDGDLGRIRDFLVDDEAWKIRHLVVDTGGFIGGRRVLISPASFRQVDWASRRVHLSLTALQLMNSPSVDADKPVSRQHELELYSYYDHGSYWAHNQPGDVDDIHLRSVNAIRNYHVHGTDAAIGHVDDFVLDEASWALRYIVVDTSNWWLGKRVLVRPQWATRVSWAEGNVYMSVTRDAIKASPIWDGDAAINGSYEHRLDEHYRRPTDPLVADGGAVSSVV